MRKYFYSAAMGVCCLFSISAISAQTITNAVNGVLQRTHHARLKETNYGIIVTSMKNGKILYQRNANRLFTPASVQKLFTAAAALQYLKPTYKFKTGFYTNGTVRHHTLEGNLYVKFSGDPSLRQKQLQKMADEFRNMDIKHINGHVYIDNFAFNKVPYPPGWIWDDLSYSYAAPMNAVIIDRNKFSLKFIPSKIKGHKPKLISSLPPGVATFTNTMRMVNAASDDCPLTIYSDMSNHYRISGCFDKRWGTQARSLAVRDMVRYAKVEITNLLKQRGIHYKGKVTLHRTPENPVPLVVHASKPISKLIHHMLKRSDNLYTNALFKAIGENYYGTSGSWQNGLRALESILKIPTGINFQKSLLTDGAGLSRYNLISPHQLVKLLYFVYHNSRVKPALYAALPVAGVDGTLVGRMYSLGRSRRVHAKTGSMTGVSALSGYVITKHHGVVGFAMMFNDFVGKRGPYVALENRVCEALAKT